MDDRDVLGFIIISATIVFCTLGAWKFLEIIVWCVNHITIK